MEKRFVSFLMISTAIMIGYVWLQMMFFPPPPREDDPAADQPAKVVADQDAATNVVGENDRDDASVPAVEETVVAEIEDDPAVIADIPAQRFTLGSLDPNSKYHMLVHFTNTGAAITRVELNSPEFHDTEHRLGYFGHLSLTPEDAGGLRVGIVGPGTPAHLAGLQGPVFAADDQGKVTMKSPGDLIVAINGATLNGLRKFDEIMEQTRPGQSINLTVQRGGQEVTLATTLVKPPLNIIRPEPRDPDKDEPPHPPSYLLTLSEIGDRSVAIGDDEIKGLPSLHHENWSARKTADEAIEFRRRLQPSELKKIGIQGNLELVKRFKLHEKQDAPRKKSWFNFLPPSPKAKGALGYQLSMDVEIHNLGPNAETVGLQIDGVSGLTTEGWWYSRKIQNGWAVAGARDVLWRVHGQDQRLFTTSSVAKLILDEDEQNKHVNLQNEATSPEDRRLRYVGNDHVYFASVLLPASSVPQPGEDVAPNVDNPFYVKSAEAITLGEVEKKRLRLANVTYRIQGDPEPIAAGETLKKEFVIFTGPKHQDVLINYGLDDAIIYGWFGAISKPLSGLLHLFKWVVRNYGLAIIMLTVLVRGSMFPLGRKMAKNAKKMQELAPEIKKLTEKHKDSPEKRMQAQRELFAKHNYNPLAGCWVMFIQMPVFLGLYRALSTDIELRQAAFIPGLQWCSNLAGPDMLLNWEHWSIIKSLGLASPFGIFGLGPYFNLLPLLTAGLFILQQKLFTPPPQDEQQEMQQKVMKFMMIFMGIMFFKVAAGLCIYFIASSLWGVGERLLLPKDKPGTTPATAGGGPAVSGNGESSGGGFLQKFLPKEQEPNGAAKKIDRKKRRKQARKR